MRNTWVFMVLAVLMTTASCATVRELPGVDMSCPAAPKCVSSQASDPGHFIEPFTFQDAPSDAMQRLKRALLTEQRVTIIDEQPAFLRAEVRSFMLRFVDDVEFALNSDQGLIHIRSSARIGFTDFGVNRKRIERIRKIFQQ